MSALERAIGIGRGFGFLLLGWGLKELIGLIYRVVVARWLGPASFGILALVTMITGIFEALFRLGLPSTISRFVAQSVARREDPAAVPSSLFPMVLVSALISSLLLFFLAEPLAVGLFHNQDAVTPFRIGAIAVFFTILAMVFRTIIIGVQRFEYLVLANTVELVMKLAATVALLCLGYALLGAVWGVIVGIISMSLVAWLCSRKLVRVNLSSASRKLMASLMKFSAPLYASSLVSIALSHADTFLIAYFWSTEEVGYYEIALGISVSASGVIAPLQSVLFPAYSEAHALKDSTLLGQMVNRSLKYNLYLLLPVAVGGFLLAEPLIGVVFGAGFLPGVVALQILAFSIIFRPLDLMTANYLVAIGKPGWSLRLTVVSAITILGLGLALIPGYGIAGAAIAFFASKVVGVMLGFLLIAKGIKIQFSFLPRGVLAVGVMALFVQFVPLRGNTGVAELIALVLGGAAVYFVSLYLVGGFDSADKRLFREIVARTVNRYGKRNVTG